MDQDAELAKFKFILFSLLLFVIAAFQSCQSLKYAVSSTRMTATVTSIGEERGRRGRHIGYRISYGFRNNNKRITGHTVVGSGEVDDYSKGQKIEIDYIGGKFLNSRIAGTGSLFWPVVLVVGLLALGGSIAALWLEASRKVAGTPGR
jgi:hypothetical protein